MSDELIKVFDYLAEKFGIVIDWTNENAMPYIQDLINRIITYNIITYAVMTVIGIAFIITAIGLIRHGIKKKKKDEYWFWDEEGFGIIVACAIMSPVGLSLIPVGIHGLLENIFLPEKVIFEIIQGVI